MYYNKETDKVLRELQTGPNGLTDEKVIKHREEYGENKLYERKRKAP